MITSIVILYVLLIVLALRFRFLAKRIPDLTSSVKTVAAFSGQLQTLDTTLTNLDQSHNALFGRVDYLEQKVNTPPVGTLTPRRNRNKQPK